MLDYDLAEIYGYEVKRLNEQVKNNISRFPEDFMFQLIKEELPDEFLKSKNSTLNEQGIYMLATVFLGTRPKEIDVLIIKKNSEETIEKNIGRIFRKHNIVEYKSPVDYLSVDDYYKVYAYACFYKSDTPEEDSIKVDEVTISFVTKRYPRNEAREAGLRQGMQQGMLMSLVELVRDGLLAMEEAVKRSKLTEEE